MSDPNVHSHSNFGLFADIALAAILRGETKAAEELLAQALPRTPFRNGDLRSSGGVAPAADPEEGAAVTFDTPYAVRLHEHPEYNFSEPGTGAKYLENAALENAKKLGDIIATEARRAAGGGPA